MKRKLLSLIPYTAVLAAAFYLLPLLGRNTGISMAFLLGAIPALTFGCALVRGIRRGFDPLLPAAAVLLFVPTVFLYYNATAWPYAIVYGLIAAAGNGIGRLFSRKKEQQN